MVQYARIGGGIGTLVTLGMAFNHYKEQGDWDGQAAIKALIAYDIDPAGDNSAEALAGRALRAYWPAIGGEVIHQVLGNPKGAFNTGIGLKLNKVTPKGMNF